MAGRLQLVLRSLLLSWGIGGRGTHSLKFSYSHTNETPVCLMDESEAVDPNRRRPTPQFTWEDLATASLPVLACFLGGATEKWAEGIVVALLGLLLLLTPPRFSLGWAFHGIVLALVAWSATAFLPATWFMQPL